MSLPANTRSRTGINPAAILYRDFDNRSRLKKMKIWVIITVLLSVVAAMSFQRATQTCHPFSATSVAIMNQNIDNPSGVFVDDPQLTYFRDIIKTLSNTLLRMLSSSSMKLTVLTSPSLLPLIRMNTSTRMHD